MKLKLKPKRSALLAVALAVSAAAMRTDAGETLVSPDGTLRVSVEVENGLSWSATRKGAALVLPSRLGLDFIDPKPWSGFRLKKAARRTLDETWTTRLYRKETVRDRANELTLDLEDADGRRLALVFRAYDEGVAFRYVVPEQPAFDGFQLRGELTEWRFPEGVDGWLTSYRNWVSSQEEDFRRRPLAGLQTKELVGMPAVVNVGEQRVALCEADLTNWAGLYYRVPKKGQEAASSSCSGGGEPCQLPPTDGTLKTGLPSIGVRQGPFADGDWRMKHDPPSLFLGSRLRSGSGIGFGGRKRNQAKTVSTATLRMSAARSSARKSGL